MENRSISVIIPVNNGEKYLAEAINSILQQSLRVSEIIIVDDGSTDTSAKIAKSFGKHINYLYQENSGVASARNNGIISAKGNLISFIDADDIWPKHKMFLQINRLSESGKNELVLGLIKRFLSDEVPAPPNYIKSRDEQPTLTLHLGAGLFKKSVFDNVGLFDENMRMGEDIDWFLRAIEGGINISILEEITYLYRIHESNMTHDNKNTNLFLLKALRKSLDRRRKHNPENPMVLPDIRNPESLRAFLQNEWQ